MRIVSAASIAMSAVHVCVIDGVFSEDPLGSVQFHEATHLTASDWDELQHTVRQRVLRYFHRQGLLERRSNDSYATVPTGRPGVLK